MALPPTSSKLSSDANEVTTFKFDFPHFTGSHTGTLVSLDVNSVAGGGTGLATLTANNVILGNGTSSPTFVAPGPDGNLLMAMGGTWISSPGGAGTGTVTSVALADASTSPIFAITGSPVTTAGTLTETLIVQPANLIFAGPTSGGSAQPTFRSLVPADLSFGSGALPSSYAQAYFSSTSTWTTTSASFVDGTNSGGNALTVRNSSGITLTAGASNVCGITFTPASSSAIYQIVATCTLTNPTTDASTLVRLTDGTNIISTSSMNVNNSGNDVYTPTTLTGVYVPGTSSPVTVKIQFAAAGGTASLLSLSSLVNIVEWSVIQLNTPAGPDMRYYSSTSTISGSLSTVTYATQDYDTNTAYSGGIYTVPQAGKYQVNAALLITGTISLNNTVIMEIQKNNSVVSRKTIYLAAGLTDGVVDIADIINCAVSDTLRIQVSTSAVAPSIVSSNFDNFLFNM